ncbi:type VI secretion system lipoprotein TssJ [Roseateles sp. DAIF2]|uniref:type VI secretion system lipoprotein TssJ n=1 Tax=Roseateles sp. DAIF2 TaxID=2714952 RepID=UPI0018A250D7|nr:type VI secretion system lipoprotein TssJ [Roseateles sp. DAIF2]QPF75654.1 type VI secretion system lipoprotein TssJ [Roseateles sp. DAIF2]
MAAGTAAALLLGACASGPKPTVLSGSIAASARVNPSVSKRPSPLLLRVYELKTANAFNAADFVSLYQRDQAELGTDLVAREELTLNPGESRVLPSKTLAAETRFVAVFAAYRDLENARWRAVVPIQPGRKQQILIQAEELAVSATVKP